MRQIHFTFADMKLKLPLFLFLFLSVLSNGLNAQSESSDLGGTQTIRGIVRDRETQRAILGAKINIDNHSISDITKDDGSFILMNVPLGRQNLTVEAKNYRIANIPNMVVTAGKEVVVNIDLDEDFESISEVAIKAKKKNDQLNNDAALVSARLFTVDETDRFAGSRGDPARMASNFAGVQGADDSRNDIVVRGNSPSGILWRMEGIDIPNPNHFAIPGTTGGSVSIINNKILGNSDFFTGAFPAEYGNAIAGVFDLKLRNGNNKKHEISSQLGFLGWDLMAEGPLSKKSKASYLFTYRYSTLSLFSKLKIPIGTDATPNYQDASFKLNFPMKNNDNFSVFGIGGTSNIDIKISDQKKPAENLYGDNDRDQYFGSNMGILGASYQKSLGTSSYLKVVVSASGQAVNAHHDLIFRQLDLTTNEFRYDSIVPFMGYNFQTITRGTHIFMNQKLSVRSTIKYGIQYTNYGYNLIDTVRDLSLKPNRYWTWNTRWNAIGSANMVVPYFQWKYKFNPKLSMVVGWQAHIYQIKYTPRTEDSFKKAKSHTSSYFVLPRLSFRYQASKKSTFNLGTGIHTQNQPSYVYFYDYREKIDTSKRTSPKNIGMDLTKSAHVVLGWDYSLGQSSRIKVETYYQYLWGIPIDREFTQTSFSLANTGSGFSRFFPNKLVNEGTAYNYGLELTVEKFFSKGFYYLFSASVFDAQYTGSDKVTRPTDFNTNYAVNGLFAKEITLPNKAVLNFGGKITMAGARRYSPMDTAATISTREYVELDAQKNTLRFGDPYFRCDFRISYKVNGKKMSHEFALDLVNVFNNQNILKYSYSDATKTSKIDYQLGFLPLFYYKLDFSL